MTILARLIRAIYLPINLVDNSINELSSQLNTLLTITIAQDKEYKRPLISSDSVV